MAGDAEMRLPAKHAKHTKTKNKNFRVFSRDSRVNPIRIAGVVLAGGKSSRFGSDKSQLVIGGKPIVQLQLEKLAKTGCEPLFVCTQKSKLITPPLHHSITSIQDFHPNLGPIGGLHAALKKITVAQSSLPVDAIFLLACDMPLISANTIRRILRAFQRCDAVVPTHDGNLEPLCAVYSRKILPAVESRIAARKLAMHDLAKSLTTHFFDVSTLANWEREFYNINTQKEYEQIRRKP